MTNRELIELLQERDPNMEVQIRLGPVPDGWDDADILEHLDGGFFSIEGPMSVLVECGSITIIGDHPID